MSFRQRTGLMLMLAAIQLRIVATEDWAQMIAFVVFLTGSAMLILEDKNE